MVSKHFLAVGGSRPSGGQIPNPNDRIRPARDGGRQNEQLSLTLELVLGLDLCKLFALPRWVTLVLAAGRVNFPVFLRYLLNSFNPTL